MAFKEPTFNWGSIEYLDILEEKVAEIVAQGKDEKALDEITIDVCGKSRIPLNGLVQDLHKANMLALYDELTGVNNWSIRF